MTIIYRVDNLRVLRVSSPLVSETPARVDVSESFTRLSPRNSTVFDWASFNLIIRWEAQWRVSSSTLASCKSHTYTKKSCTHEQLWHTDTALQCHAKHDDCLWLVLPVNNKVLAKLQAVHLSLVFGRCLRNRSQPIALTCSIKRGIYVGTYKFHEILSLDDLTLPCARYSRYDQLRGISVVR